MQGIPVEEQNTLSMWRESGMEYLPQALGVVFLCCMSGAVFVPVLVSLDDGE